MAGWTYERRHAAWLGREMVTVPDLVADNQHDANRLRTVFAAIRADGSAVLVRLHGDAYGLGTSGRGDMVVRRVRGSATWQPEPDLMPLWTLVHPNG
jgi:hypothetical protein